MVQQLVVGVDSMGTSAVLVPLVGLWGLLRLLPAGLAAISYHYQSQQAKVSFPGLGLRIAQQIVDAALRRGGASFDVQGGAP